MEEFESALNNLQRESRELINAVMDAMVEAVVSKHISPVRLSLSLVERFAKERVASSFPVICLIDALLTASVNKPIHSSTSSLTGSINNNELQNSDSNEEEVRQRVFAAVLTAFWTHALPETFTLIHTHSLIRNKTERIVKRWGQRGLVDATNVGKILNAIRTGHVKNELTETIALPSSSSTVKTEACIRVQETTPQTTSATIIHTTQNEIDVNDNEKEVAHSDTHSIHRDKAKEHLKETNTLTDEITHTKSANILIDSNSINNINHNNNNNGMMSGNVLWSETETKELITLLKSCHANLERLPSSTAAQFAEEINAQLTSTPSLRALHFLRVATQQLQNEADKFASHDNFTSLHEQNTYRRKDATSNTTPNASSIIEEQHHHLENTHKSSTKESFSALLDRLHSQSTMSTSSHHLLTDKNETCRQSNNPLHYQGETYNLNTNYNSQRNTSTLPVISSDGYRDSNLKNNNSNCSSNIVCNESKSSFPHFVSDTSEENSLAHRSECGELLTYRDLYKWQALRDKLEHDLKLKEEIEKSDIVTQMQHWREIKLQERQKKEHALMESKNKNKEIRADSSNSSTSSAVPVSVPVPVNKNSYNSYNNYRNNNYHGRDYNRRRRRHMYRYNNDTTNQQFGNYTNNYNINRQTDNNNITNNNVFESNNNDNDEKCAEKDNNKDETRTTKYYVDHFPRVITSNTPVRRPFRIPPSRQIQQSEFVRLPFPSESVWIQTAEMDKLALFASKAELSKYKIHK